jgi:hypothetical protein
VGAAGFTVGSETSGGIRRVDVSGLHVFAGAPNGILFKSARTRGGTVDHINVRDVHLENVAVPVRVALNWNPRYSYAQIPPGIQNVPPYYRILAQPVPTSQGMPHLRDVQISDLTATGARSAFEVSGYPSAPIEDFLFEHLNIAAKAAGTIADAENWTFIDTEIHTADGSHIVLKDCRNIKGLE